MCIALGHQRAQFIFSHRAERGIEQIIYTIDHKSKILMSSYRFMREPRTNM